MGEEPSAASAASDAPADQHSKQGAEVGAGELMPTLQLLDFQVALRRHDPNARAVLERVARMEAVTPAQLQTLANECFSTHQHELGVLALERALARLQAAEPKDYPRIFHVLRWLIKTAARREHAWPRFEAVSELISGFSDANCPLSSDELQWLLGEAWNKGTACFNERKLDEAERWMAAAFSFSTYSPALAGYRAELEEQYQACLKELHQLGPDGWRATEWQSRMAKRILEADDEMDSRRKRIRFG